MESTSETRRSSEFSAQEQERRLVERVLVKDRKATAEFVAFCADAIYSFVRRRMLPRTELVDDIMQEILLAAWQGLQRFRNEASLRSWILGIARHKIDDYYRSRLRDLEITEEEPGSELMVQPGMDLNLDTAAEQDRVQRTLQLLPEAYALALIWRYRDEKSLREMAQLSGKTEKAMERLLARARENFRRRWTDVGS